MVQTYQAHSQYPAPYSTLIPAYFNRYPNPLATHVLSVDVLERTIVRRSSTSKYFTPAAAASSTASSSAQQLPQPQEDGEAYVLRTSRLILKKGTLPSWAPRGLVRNSESWVLEVSEVDLDPPNTGRRTAAATELERGAGATEEGRRMRSWTRNLDHTTVLAITESLELAEGTAVSLASSSKVVPTTSNEAVASAARQGTVAALTKSHITSDVSMLGRRIEKFGLKRFIAHANTSRAGLLSTHASLLNHLAGKGALPSSSTPVKSKKAKLAAALRPPFLDGEYIGPIARLRLRAREVRAWWRELGRAGTAALRGTQDAAPSTSMTGGADGKMTPTEWLRARLLNIRKGVEEVQSEDASEQREERQ